MNAFPDADIAKPALTTPFRKVCDTPRMSRSAPASYHLDFYRYWLAKRGDRTMPPRSSIDPAEIPPLLPYLGIIEKANGELRYRLMGTAMVQQLGCDVTGGIVGSYVPAGQALRSTVELVRTSASPIFNTARYELELGTVHYSSVLLLPLSEDERTVNIVVFLRIVRFQPYGWASCGWLRNARVKVGEPILIQDIDHLETLAADWERACS
jgi:hypothetical protein